ncbi:MAG: RDD family protein [Rickettsiales bacterium]
MKRYPLPPAGVKESDAFPVDYATFSQRLLASALDSAISFFVIAPFLMAAQHFFHFADAIPAHSDAAAIYQKALAGTEKIDLKTALPLLSSVAALQGKLLALQSAILIPLVLWCWMKFDTTPGKWVMRLRIADATSGSSLSASQCITRLLGYVPSVLFLGLGFVWIIFSSRRQGWHDMMAGAVVLRIKNSAWIETIPG